jgi:hypothetical protein
MVKVLSCVGVVALIGALMMIKKLVSKRIVRGEAAVEVP